MQLLLPLLFTAAITDTVPNAALLQPQYKEISGICYSKKNPGLFWAQQDGGNAAALLLIDTNGIVRTELPLQGAANRDWEDITIAGKDLYIAETGDNGLKHQEYAVYRLPEPAATDTVIKTWEKISFAYPDGPHDAEALLVDPGTKDIYIITKRDKPSRIYRIAYPYSKGLNNAVSLGQIGFGGVVSASWSPDGKRLLVKTYFAVFSYTRKPGEPLAATLKKIPQSIPYYPEPQGEAISFTADGKGFVTLSEKGFGKEVKLYKYRF